MSMAAIAVRNKRKKKQQHQQQLNFISKAVIATPILEVNSELDSCIQSQVSIPTSVLRLEEVTGHSSNEQIVI